MCSVDALPYFDTCIHGDIMTEYMSLSEERREVKNIGDGKLRAAPSVPMRSAHPGPWRQASQ